MRVRLLRISGLDLNLFEFDYDLTWAAFFMNASGKVHGRFGGRDAKGPDTRNSLVGLHFAMQMALEEHKRDPDAKPANLGAQPKYVENMPTAKASYSRGCIHCHQVNEIIRQDEINAGTWNRDKVYSFPLPDNLGFILDIDQGNRVQTVKPASPADRAGLKPGDLLKTLNHVTVHSFADAQYALHKAPATGDIPIVWTRDGQTTTAKLPLFSGWRWTNITWRPSLLDMLPSLRVYGSDLTEKEKTALGLDPKRLAFREEEPVHSQAKAMGVRENDIILGVDNKTLEMSMDQFLGYVRQHYLLGETMTLNIIRDGKRLDLKVTLK